MNSINLILFKVDESTNIFSISNSFEEDEAFDVYKTVELIELSSIFEMNHDGVFLFSIKMKEDLQHIVEILKKNKNEIKAGKLKPVFVQEKRNQKIEILLSKLGCKDFIESSINEKSFKFKIDFWKKSLLKNIKKSKSANLSSNQKSEENIIKAKGVVIQVDALQKDEVDFWLSPEHACKRVLNKWLINLHGPSPHVGKWESDSDDKWKFIIESKADKAFKFESGHWFFEGMKPEFNWKLKTWTFSSDNPSLYFLNEMTHYKFRLQDENLNICKNSKHALSLKEKILDSANSEFNIESNNSLVDNDKESFDKKNKIDTKMKGDSETEKMDGYYSGEVDMKKKKDQGLDVKIATKKNNNNYSFENSDAESIGKEYEVALEDTEESGDFLLDQITESTEVVAKLSNESSKDTFYCRFEDLYEDTLVVSYEKDSLPMEESFIVNVTLNYGKETVTINTIGKIIEREESNYTVELDKVEQVTLDKFMRLFEERQDNILVFLKMAKGY